MRYKYKPTSKQKCPSTKQLLTTIRGQWGVGAGRVEGRIINTHLARNNEPEEKNAPISIWILRRADATRGTYHRIVRRGATRSHIAEETKRGQTG